MRSLGRCLIVGLLLASGWGARAATCVVAREDSRASDEGPGTPDRPWMTLGRAAAAAGPGDSVLIRGGVYRERLVIKASGTAEAPIRFEAAPGEPVVLTGADRLTGWRRETDAQPVYQVSWPHRFIGWNRSMAHPDDDRHRLIGRCEQVIVEGYLLRQVLAAHQLAPGTFLADVTNRTLSVWDSGSRDLNKVHAEASVRQEILRVEGDHVHVRGLRFRYAASMAQHGAVVLAGRHDTIEDCVVEFMNAQGATFTGTDAVVRRCVFRDNGQLGFGAHRAHRLAVSDCLVENNNTKGFDRGWEAGGNKLVLCRDVVLERSRFMRNRGNGVWFDIGNTNGTVRRCLIADNEDAGLFYEISHALRAHDNVIVGNGFAATPGAWGAQAGISISSSPGGVVERNLIAGNREGFNFREQTRTTPAIDDPEERPVWNQDELIRNNLIVFNRDAQIWGWFDVADDRHWPAEARSTSPPAAADSARPADLAAPYAAKTAAGQPAGLSLDRLRLRFERNVYFAAPGQGWFHWGPGWARHKRYAGLPEFQSDLGLDAGSRVQDPGFADLIRLDLRLPPAILAALQDCYPQGPVPGVELGARPP